MNFVKKFGVVLLIQALLFSVMLYAAVGSRFDFTLGTTPGNPGVGKVRLWGNTATGKIECLDNSGLACGQTTIRTCVLDNDTQSATALVVANFSGACAVDYPATIVEVDVWGGTGVTGGTLTTTGTGSINIQKFTPNGGATTTLLSGALATASGLACALTATSGTCANGLTSSSSITVSVTSVSAGDWIRVSAATPDTAQTWYRIAVHMISSN